MIVTPSINFTQPGLARLLDGMEPHELDELAFGVIGFDDDTGVKIYNRTEATLAGLSVSNVLGQRFFTNVAPCMNNFMVAQRFEDAHRLGHELDATIDYVLTLRMRPTKVKLRLLSHPGLALNFVLVDRSR
ncbi:photoactive yellow protein [Noviherbaspirillum humi]|uniref:Photoactive yellow protein n=1 Tax=Noviherbaspirillum humi TaxID=1688639 RepID=A0A239I0P4_9BURK|nr:phosphonate transporter [Noviherbaspirillum humi]SNS87396.1 photoactive yellow protein [Noviherbaspirillum humi]